MGKHTIQSVGGFTAIFQHPLILAGAAIALSGFKLEEAFVESEQDVENSKRVYLVDGGSAALTNNIRGGTLTINACRKSQKLEDGDVILIAQTLQALGDSQGGMIRFTIPMDGDILAYTYLSVTVKKVPPVKLAGNDVSTYPVVFSYADYVNA
jgi:hypothetical protein